MPYKGQTSSPTTGSASKSIRKPVIAAVSGLALGGCELAMMCDIVFAADTARFALPEVKLAVVPGRAAPAHYPRAVGKAMKPWTSTSSPVARWTPEEAEQTVWCRASFRPTPCSDRALKAAREIAGYSLPVLMMLKRSPVRPRLGKSPLKRRSALRAAPIRHMPARPEGMAALPGEKRKPVFERTRCSAAATRHGTHSNDHTMENNHDHNFPDPCAGRNTKRLIASLFAAAQLSRQCRDPCAPSARAGRESTPVDPATSQNQAQKTEVRPPGRPRGLQMVCPPGHPAP